MGKIIPQLRFLLDGLWNSLNGPRFFVNLEDGCMCKSTISFFFYTHCIRMWIFKLVNLKMFKIQILLFVHLWDKQTLRFNIWMCVVGKDSIEFLFCLFFLIPFKIYFKTQDLGKLLGKTSISTLETIWKLYFFLEKLDVVY